MKSTVSLLCLHTKKTDRLFHTCIIFIEEAETLSTHQSAEPNLLNDLGASFVNFFVQYFFDFYASRLISLSLAVSENEFCIY